MQPKQAQEKPQKLDKIRIFDIDVGRFPVSLKFTWKKLIFLLRKFQTK